MKLACLYSGGKDSNYALYWALNQGFEITNLVTIRPKSEDSFMYHKPCLQHVKLQAESIGIPLIEKESQGIKEEELKELEDVLSKLDVDGVISGAVASEYQKTRIEAIGERLGFRTYSPLWHKNQRQLLEDINNAGFKAIIVGIAAEGFDESWLGRQINKETIEELERLHKKYGINMTGEGGEYETFITDGPTFKKKVEIQHLKKKMQNRNTGTLEIRKAMLKNASAT